MACLASYPGSSPTEKRFSVGEEPGYEARRASSGLPWLQWSTKNYSGVIGCNGLRRTTLVSCMQTSDSSDYLT